MQALGNRRHAIGIVVTGLEIIFYLYDRAGTIYCQDALELRRDAPRIISALLSLMLITPYQLGLEPVFSPIPRPFSNPSKLPSLSHTRLASIAAAGRLNSVKGCRIQVADRTFELEDLIKSTDELFGRGTVVYKAKSIRKHRTRSTTAPSHSPNADATEDSEIPEHVVLKLSWQICSRQNEDELLKLAAEKGVEGIVKLYRSEVITRLSQGLRGRLVPKGLRMYRDRELRIQILGPVCIPLYHVQDLDDFRKAFVSLIKSESSSKWYRTHNLEYPSDLR